MIKSALVILSGNAFSALMLLIRNLLVARLISVENYGIAATFSLALAVIEMTSTFGLQQQLVQDKRGNDPDFQAALQGFQVVRGIVNAAILFALAGPFASFMGVPQVTWAHQLITVILVMNGFVHFDMYRLGRRMQYVPAAMAAVLAPLAALAAIWPLHKVYGDYQVMLWSLIIQSAATALVSHLVAERPYRIRLDREVMRQSLAFGWPLLIDGLLLFAIFNGEKVIVGRAYGMEPLALFTMAVTLTLTPALVLQRSASSFFLPQLSVGSDRTRFGFLSAVTMQSHLMFGALLVATVVIGGGPFVELVLGAKYQPVLPLLNLLAVMQALKLMKGGAATISLAQGRTSNGMIANILRVATMPVAFAVALAGGDILTVIWIGITGELIGLGVSLLLLHQQVKLKLGPMIPGLALVLVVLVVTGLGAAGKLPDFWPLVMLALLIATPVVMPELRSYVMARVVTHHGD